MPRASFSDVAKGGAGFQEGRIRVLESYSTMFQYPPNSTTHEQSEAFPALVWRAVRVDDNGKPRQDGDGNDIEVEVVHRMGSIDEAGHYNVRPGKLDAKDFDNTDVEPQDLGTDLETRGNSYVMDEGAKFHIGWGFIDESLKKCAFKPEILGRCVTTDFEGMDALFGQQEGTPYIAKKGKKKGEEVKPSNLVCKRIFVYPYDAPKGAGGSSTSKITPATGANKGAQSAGGAGATGGAGGATPDAMEGARVIFSGGTHALINGGKPVDGLSPEFRKVVPADKEVKMDDFRKAITSELMRRKVNPNLQKAIMEGVVKSDDRMGELAGWLMENDRPTFMTDGKTIQFQAAG